MEGKKTKGKQKIEIKLIENMEEKFVTFSKRRSGINKKASELVTLTGAEIAFVVFSPAGKPFSFGHQSTDSIIRRYLRHEQQDPSDSSEQIVEVHRQIKINDLNNHHNKLIQKMDVDNQKMKELKESIDASRGEDIQVWWETPIEDLSFGDLIDVNNAYKEIFAMISTKLQEKAAGGSSTSSSQPNPNLNPPPSGYISIDNLRIAQISGPLFETGAGSGSGGPLFDVDVGTGSGGGVALFEGGADNRGGCPLFEAGSNSGGGGPLAPDPAPSDLGHQWGSL